MHNFKNSFHFRSMKRFPFTLYIESGTNYVDHVSSNEFVIFTLISFQKSVIVKWTLESLRNGDGNENGKKGKQQLCTCITLFYTCQFTHCTTTTWNCLIARLEEDVNTRRLSFFPELRLSPLKLNPRKTGIPFIVRGSPNECWLHTNDACVITTWRLWSWAPLVARNKTSENFAKIWRIKWDEIVWRSEIQLTF